MPVQCPFTDALSLGEKGELDVDSTNNEACDNAQNQSIDLSCEDNYQGRNKTSLRRTIALLALPLMAIWLGLLSSSLFLSSRINLPRICVKDHNAYISLEDATAGGLFWWWTSLLSIHAGLVVSLWSMEQFFPESELDTIGDIGGMVLSLPVAVSMLMDPSIVRELVCLWRGGDQLVAEFLKVSVNVQLLALIAIAVRTRLYGGRAAVRREIASMGPNISGALRRVIGRG